jgi:hypothetical protein
MHTSDLEQGKGPQHAREGLKHVARAHDLDLITL